MTDRSKRYARLLRWYPRDWRIAHGDAIIGVLMDADDAHRRSFPPLSERLSLAATGLWQRQQLPVSVTRLRLAGRVAAALFASWYAVVITGTSHGAFGVFTNPSAVVAVLLIIAFGLTVAGRDRLAGGMSLAAVGAALIIGVLSEVYGWMGPGPDAVTLLTSSALLAATPLQSLSQLIRAVLVVPLATVGVAAISIAIASGLFVTQLLVSATVAIAALSVAALLAASVQQAIAHPRQLA